MEERVRAHERIDATDIRGSTININNLLAKSVEIFIPEDIDEIDFTRLVIHFHGSGGIPQYAVSQLDHPLIVAVVNLGSGSSVYERPFKDTDVFNTLIDEIHHSVSEEGVDLGTFSKIVVTSFSAGYGAVRAILRHHASKISGLILLDGLHSDYVPEGRTLYQGGRIDEKKLEPFLEFAGLSRDGKTKFLITHSEIFPGTYPSTTETADYIINALGLERKAVLKWGPCGMQQISETHVNGLTILGFAGNSGPDHIDHYHGLPVFLKQLLTE